MTEQTTQQKKKRKKKEYLLLTDFDSLTEEEVLSSLTDMRKKIRDIFKSHIGQGNSISPVELFQQVYGLNPTYLDIFKKNYWWGILKMVLRSLRKDDTLFIINEGTKLYVLQTQEESEKFKRRIDTDIKNLKNIKLKADDWVRHKRWKSLVD